MKCSYSRHNGGSSPGMLVRGNVAEHFNIDTTFKPVFTYSKTRTSQTANSVKRQKMWRNELTCPAVHDLDRRFPSRSSMRMPMWTMPVRKNPGFSRAPTNCIFRDDLVW